MLAVEFEPDSSRQIYINGWRELAMDFSTPSVRGRVVIRMPRVGRSGVDVNVNVDGDGEVEVSGDWMGSICVSEGELAEDEVVVVVFSLSKTRMGEPSGSRMGEVVKAPFNPDADAADDHSDGDGDGGDDGDGVRG